MPPPVLNPGQQDAIAHIHRALSTHTFTPFLLQGITGSGKTEVYLHLVNTVLQQGKQALVLIPEIGLTPQTVSRFTARLGNTAVYITHSGCTEKQRLHTWTQAHSHTPCVVIGTRSALFSPLPKLGLLILDEEHDNAFKQQTQFRHSARDMAVMRAKQAHIPIVLGSATPSLETLYNVQQQRYQALYLTHRAGSATSPHFHIENLRGRRLKHGLSPALFRAMRTHLNAGQQVLLFVNRRGYAPVLLCHHCGWHADCPHCDARLVYHRMAAQLHCHHCHYQKPSMTVCPACECSEVIPVGMGTERLEAALKNHFPDTPLLRIDSDSTRKKGSFNTMLHTIASGQPLILIGTQMLAKGHHFSHLTLVAIVEADYGLLSMDFRAIEKMGQLFIQVGGRAGRAHHPGTVWIQTHYPDHPLLACLLKQGYAAFATQLLSEREKSQLPPYTHLALVRAQAKEAALAMTWLEKKSQALQHLFSDQTLPISVEGPIPTRMHKKQGVFRTQLLLRAKNRHALHTGIHAAFTQSIFPTSPHGTVRWFLEIDPLDVF